MPRKLQADKNLSSLSYKKDLIINAVRLGMAWRDAAMSFCLQDAEIIRLEKDPDFLRDVSATEKILERELLQLHDRAIEAAVEKGNGAPIQWRLACLNPTRYGGKTSDGTSSDLDLNLTIRKLRVGNAD